MEKNRKNNTSTQSNLIGLGMTMGGLISLLIMMPSFGNGEEAWCVIPVIILGFFMMTKDDKKE